MLVEKESAEDMEANIEKLLDWKRKINPGIWGKLYHSVPSFALCWDYDMHDIGASIKYKAMFSYSDAEAM